jgi:hypothetical protein
MSEYELLNREVDIKDRTPVTQAVEIIMLLSGMWEHDFNGDMYHKRALTELLNAEKIDGAAAKENISNWSNGDPKLYYAGFLYVVFSYCVQAIREYMDNHDVPTNLAWAYVDEARYELSVLDYARTRLATEKQIPDLIQSAIKERESDAGKSLWAKELVESAIKARSSEGGKARAANDPKTRYVKEIEEIEYPLKMRLFHLRGRRDEFITDMHVKYPDLSRDTIANLVDRLNKQNGITQRKLK